MGSKLLPAGLCGLIPPDENVRHEHVDGRGQRGDHHAREAHLRERGARRCVNTHKAAAKRMTHTAHAARGGGTLKK